MQYSEYVTGETILMWYGKFLCYNEVYAENTCKGLQYRHRMKMQNKYKTCR